TDHRHFAAFEKRTVTVWTVGHAVTLVLGFAGHTHLAPAGTGSHDHAAGTKCGAGFLFHREQAFGVTGADAAHTLGRHQVDRVFLHVFFQAGQQARALSGLLRDEVLDRHGVEHLTAEVLGYQTRVQALARGVDGRRGTRGATA